MAKKKGLLASIIDALKEAGPFVGIVSTALVAGGGFIPFWLTSSGSLRTVILIGVILGGIVGYIVTPYAWSRRKKRPGIYAIACGIAIALTVVLFTLVNPANQWAPGVQDFLLVNPVLFNVLAFLFVGTVFFSATSFVCVIASRSE